MITRTIQGAFEYSHVKYVLVKREVRAFWGRKILGMIEKE